MDKKIISILLVFIFMFSLIGCQSSPADYDWSDIYISVFDVLMEEDDALNDDMAYIAINGDALANASSEDIDKILEHFEKYDVDVINESMESLTEKGMVIDDFYIEGVYLEVTDVQIESSTKVIIEASKYKSGLGAIGMSFTLEKEKDHWTITDNNQGWAS